MNIYRYEFFAKCPANNKMIVFLLEIVSKKTIMVEHIITACALYPSVFHEELADRLLSHFPDTRQVLKAHHHGVDIETVRE